ILGAEIHIDAEIFVELVRQRDIDDKAAARLVEGVVYNGAGNRQSESAPTDRYRHSLRSQRGKYIFLAVGTKVHQVRPNLDGSTEGHDASRTEHSDSVAGLGKRAPGFDLAGSAFPNLRVIDVVGTAEPCCQGR